MTRWPLLPDATGRYAASYIVETMADVTHDLTPRTLSFATRELVRNLDTIRRDLDGFDEDQRRRVVQAIYEVVQQRLTPEDLR